MLDAVMGAVIMVVATTSLLYSIELAERAFKQAGRYPLSDDERAILRSVSSGNNVDPDEFWRQNIQGLPREVGLDE